MFIAVMCLIGHVLCMPLETTTPAPSSGLNFEAAVVPHCDSITYTANHDTGVHQQACYMPKSTDKIVTRRDTETADAESAVPIISGPYCYTEEFNEMDAVMLCNGIPSSFSLSPAYSDEASNCEVWTYGTAAWAICNEDTTQSLDDPYMSGHCRNANDNCRGSNGSRRARFEASNPNGWEALYRNGGQGLS